MNLTKRAHERLETFFKDQSDIHSTLVTGDVEGRNFALSDEVEHEWIHTLAGDDAFLNEISIGTVTTQKFDFVDTEFNDLVAGRVNTETHDRPTTNIGGTTGASYIAEPTDHDTHVTFDTLNDWAMARNNREFQKMVEERRRRTVIEDLQRIGWNGTSVAKPTNKIGNPLGQDVNLGWIKNIKENAATQVIDASEGGGIEIDPEGEFSSIDAIALYMKELIPSQYHNDLRFYASSNFFTARNVRLAETSQAFELVNGNAARAMHVVGGDIIARTPRYFPDDTVVLTVRKNLAFRVQRASQRKGYFVNHKRSRIENYFTQNEAFPVANYEAVIVLENLVFADPGK